MDWEAILASDLEIFNQSVKPWLFTGITIDASWQSLPDVSSTFGTTGAAIGALSSYDF